MDAVDDGLLVLKLGAFVVMRPSTTCLPAGTLASGAKLPERSSSNSRKKALTCSFASSASATPS